MKNLLWSVPLLIVLMFGLSFAGAMNFQIEWDPVTQNADGTPLTDLSHYKFYVCEAAIGDDGACALNSLVETVDKGQVDASFDYTTVGREGTVFVRGAAVDTTGNASVLSDAVSIDFKDDVAPQKLIIRIKLP